MISGQINEPLLNSVFQKGIQEIMHSMQLFVLIPKKLKWRLCFRKSISGLLYLNFWDKYLKKKQIYSTWI